MMKYYSIIMMMICYLGVDTIAHSQANPVSAIKEQLFARLAQPEVTYKYTIFIYDDRTGKVNDQINGVMLSNGKDYKDSNTAMLTITGNDLFLELNFRDKEATVAGIRQLKKNVQKAGGVNSILSLPDSMVVKQGKISYDTVSTPGTAIVTIDLKKAEIVLNEVKLYINRKQLLIDKLYYSYTVSSTGDFDNDDGYRYTCLIYDIAAPAPQQTPDISRYLTGRKKKYALLAPYSVYKLVHLN